MERDYERKYLLLAGDTDFEISLGKSDTMAINTLEEILDSIINTCYSYDLPFEEIIDNIKSDCSLSDDEIKEVD